MEHAEQISQVNQATSGLEPYTLVGLIVLVIGMAIKEIFSWFKERNLQDADKRMVAIEEGQKDLNKKVEDKFTRLEPFLQQIDEMYDWHDKSDQDGVKIWYIRQSLENVLRDNANAIGVLAKNSELQTSLLKEMIESQKVILREQTTVVNEIKLLQRNRDE